MSKKNWHLKKYLSGKIPEPEIRVDEAWIHMENMLGKIPVPDSLTQQTGTFKFVLKYVLGILAGTATVCTSLYFLTRDQNGESQLQHHAFLNEKYSDSLAAGTHQQELPVSRRPLTIPKRDSAVSSLSSEQNQGINLTANALSDATKFGQPIQRKTILGLTEELKKQTYHIKRNTTAEKSNNGLQMPIANQNAVNSITPGKQVDVMPSRLNDRKASGDFNKNPTFPTSNKLADRTLKPGSREKVEVQPNPRILYSVQMLSLKPAHFAGPAKNLFTVVRYDNEKRVQSVEKSNLAFPKAFQIGLEWNAATSFNDTKYILTGTDSTKRPYLLLIPGIWLSKRITDRQQLTIEFYFYQPYFGGSRLVRKIPETNIVGSTNTRFIKAAGTNFSLRYEYLLSSNWRLSAGIGYSRLTKGLFKENYVNYANEPLNGSMVSFQKQDLTILIKPNLFTFRPGISFERERFQLGANLIIPMGNVSSTTIPIRPVNGQVSFRLRLH